MEQRPILPDTARKAIRRSINKQSGFQRVEAVLSAHHLECLGYLMKAHGITRAEAIVMAIEAAVDGATLTAHSSLNQDGTSAVKE